MNQRLASYLQDNRDQIIENWLTEADVPPPSSSTATDGSVPVAFLQSTFDRIIRKLQGRECKCRVGEKNKADLTLCDIIEVTCACQAHRLRGHVCRELYESGFRAFMSVLTDTWDPECEFSQLDRHMCAELINQALAWNFGQEAFHCPERPKRQNCPFNFNN